MNTIAQIQKAMKQTLEEEAQRLEKSSNFVQRQSKLGGKLFVQTLVYGVMANPEMSYTHLAQAAGIVGVRISPQGLEQRFTEGAVRLMEGVYQSILQQKIMGSPTRLAILKRFQGVYLQDSSVITLPQELEKVWPGVGSRYGKSAGVKLHVCLNFSSGELQGPILTHARVHDRNCPDAGVDIPVGGLRIADLGYFTLEQFARDQDAGVYWLSRYKAGTVLLDQDGQRIDLVKLLKGVDQLDREVRLGLHYQVPSRLLVQRVPQEVADQRRRRLHEYAIRKQTSLSDELLALAQWTILITNAPQDVLSLSEARVMYKVRWQIELLFKLWKQHAILDEWRSQNPNRILCELYAKLIAVIIMQWFFIPSFWVVPARSLFKASQVIQSLALSLAATFHKDDLFLALLETVQGALASGCSMNSRHAKPNTYQTLLGS